jgi:hypothetical protein
MPYLHWEIEDELDERKRFIEKLEIEDKLDERKRFTEKLEIGDELDESKRFIEKLEKRKRFIEQLDKRKRSIEKLERRKRFMEQLDKKKRSIEQLETEAGLERLNWEKFLSAYLRDGHQLHIRRTLDQYYYHTLPNTEERDKDQVVSRYYNKFPKLTRVTTMVDQLWLWVLVGTDGRADTVISSFPQRTIGRSSRSFDDPDPYGWTDVLRNVLLHIRAEQSSVKTAYDLAGVIASECSRAYLNTSNTQSRELQFAEIYESSIGDVVSTFISSVRRRS